ncbi:MAG: hypothetical protein MJ151_01350, partial [Lachnospiraceae bacterium]|nr:hypothetical protein [Lachnospiraceae bacterium]
TNFQAGLVMFPFVLITLGYAIYLRLSTYNNLLYSILNFVNDNTTKQEHFLKNVSIPYAVCDEKGILIYASKYFLNLSNEVNIGKNITSIFSEIYLNIRAKYTIFIL